jgi:hypothetical protein
VSCRRRNGKLNGNVEAKSFPCWKLYRSGHLGAGRPAALLLWWSVAAGITGVNGPLLAIRLSSSARAYSSARAGSLMNEEEISEVSLATFHVFGRESAGTQRPRTRPESAEAPAGRTSITLRRHQRSAGRSISRLHRLMSLVRSGRRTRPFGINHKRMGCTPALTQARP